MTGQELKEVIKTQWRAHGLKDPDDLQVAAAVNAAISYAVATTLDVVYRREVHAAHTPSGSWDAETWDAVQPWNSERPQCVPIDASGDYGYRDQEGRQHVVWSRSVRSEGRCERCPSNAGTGCSSGS